MKCRIPKTLLLLGVAFFGIPSLGVISQEREDTEPVMSGAFRSALERLEERKDTPQVGALFLDALRSADSIASVEWLVDEYYPSITSDSERSTAALEIGKLYELAHHYEDARRFYGEALRIDRSDDEAAIRTASVLIEIGNVTEALIPLNAVLSAPDSRGSQRQAAVIRGRALFLSGETERALRQARSLAGMDEPYDPERPPLVEIDAYALLLDIAQQIDDAELFAEGYDRIADSFPESPILEMYRSYRGVETDAGYRVTPYPSPSRLIRPNLPIDVPVIVSDTDPPTGRTSTNTSGTKVIGIQTGSFRDRENAEYMAIDITELGFAATISEVAISGDTYYRVLVEVPDGAGSVEEVQNYVVRLKERGIEGFLVFAE